MTIGSGNRFVILHHVVPSGEHWDLMLERSEALATWQLHAEPRGHETCPIACTQIGDHRVHYLTYEGPVSGGRGDVKRIDAGTYEMISIEPECWHFILKGELLRGRFQLSRTDSTDSSKWILGEI